jgi:hypothetical protein
LLRSFEKAVFKQGREGSGGISRCLRRHLDLRRPWIHGIGYITIKTEISEIICDEAVNWIEIGHDNLLAVLSHPVLLPERAGFRFYDSFLSRLMVPVN